MLTLALVVMINAAPNVQMKARAAFIEHSVPGAVTLKVGDHIDVIAVVNDPDTKQSSAVMLLQNVVVVGNEAGFTALLLLPEEATLLALARVNGQLNVALRNVADIDVLEERKPDTLRTILPKPKK